MKTSTFVLAAFAVAGVVAAVAGAHAGGRACCNLPAAEASKMESAGVRSVTLQIDGMDCAACSTAIRITLKKLAGVKEAKVSYAKKQAVVDYDPGKVTPQELVDAVNRLGYRTHLAPKG